MTREVVWGSDDEKAGLAHDPRRDQVTLHLLAEPNAGIGSSVALRTLSHVPPAELDIPIFGHLATTHLPLGDAFEPGPLEVISLDVALRGLAAQTISAGTRDAGP